MISDRWTEHVGEFRRGQPTHTATMSGGRLKLSFTRGSGEQLVPRMMGGEER